MEQFTCFSFKVLHIMKPGACARIITILWSLWSFPLVLSSPVSSAREVLLSLLCHNQWICTHFKMDRHHSLVELFWFFPGLLSLPLKVLIMRANLHSTIFWSLCYFQGSILSPKKKKKKEYFAFWKLRVGNEEGQLKYSWVIWIHKPNTIWHREIFTEYLLHAVYFARCCGDSRQWLSP